MCRQKGWYVGISAMSVAVGLGFQASQAKFSVHFSTRMDCLKGRVHTRRRQGTRRISESEVLKERGEAANRSRQNYDYQVNHRPAHWGLERYSTDRIYMYILFTATTRNRNKEYHYSLDGLLQQRHIFHFKVSCQKKRHSRRPTQKNEH
jgi:hypothetical protein